MKDHSNGRENASQLESRLTDRGVFFPSANSAHGFIVVGSEHIYVVEEERPDSAEGFNFHRVERKHVHEFTVELGEPEARYDQDPNAEKTTDGGNTKPTTHIRLWMASKAFDFYADADPRAVTSAFVTESTTTNA